MNTILKYLDKAMSFILIVLVAFLAIGVSVTVVLRYFFGLSFSTLEELLTMAFIFTTLFGSALAIREKQHMEKVLIMGKTSGDLDKSINLEKLPYGSRNEENGS